MENKRTFIHLAEAYYAKSTLLPDEVVDEVLMRICDDGYESNEVMFRWHDLNGTYPFPRLEVFDDAWDALPRIHDVLDALSQHNGQHIAPSDFCKLLLTLGFEDVTPRVNPHTAPDDTDDDPEVARLSAELDRLRARVAELEGALKPFAALDRLNTSWDDDSVVTASLESLMTVLPMGDFTLGDIRRAAAVLAQS